MLIYQDRWGRRWGMFIGASIIIAGTCIQAPATSQHMFMGGRFILGFGGLFPHFVGCSPSPHGRADIFLSCDMRNGGTFVRRRDGTSGVARNTDWNVQHILVCGRDSGNMDNFRNAGPRRRAFMEASNLAADSGFWRRDLGMSLLPGDPTLGMCDQARIVIPG